MTKTETQPKTETKFFFYEKNPFGGWSPCTAMQRPLNKRAEGAKRETKGVVQLHPAEHFRCLQELMLLYPLEETKAA